MYYPGLTTHGPPKRTSILRFTPPGIANPLDIPFPGRVLPVCARCKKNYKTREHCRSKEGHNGLPWTDTYICITMDNTCFAPDGSMINGTFHAQGVQSNPYVYPDNITLDPKTPSCAQCKDKNYTRTYCRMSKKHKTLPWSTVYVTLTLVRGPDGATAPPNMGTPAITSSPANAESDEPTAKKMKKNDGEASSGNSTEETADDAASKVKGEVSKDAKEEGSKAKTSSDATDADAEKKAEDADKEEEKPKDIDIFKNPHPSRTFLATVSVKKNEVQWVDLDQGAVALMQHRAPKVEQDGAEVPPHGMYPPHSPYQMMPQGMHPGMSMNMHPGMGYPGMTGPVLGQIPGGATGGNKDDPNRPSNGMDNQHPQWGMGGGGMPGGPGQYPTPEMMYNAAQMMDPRMGGYGFQPGWPGRGGYPMEMPGMQGMQGGPQGQMGQMQSPYDGHMMQQMSPAGWGGGHPGMGPQQGGGGMPQGGVNGDMPQSLPPNSSPGGMQQQGQGMPPQGMSRHMPPGMPENNPNGNGSSPHDMKGVGGMSPPGMMGGSETIGAKDSSKDNNSSETLQI